MNMWPVTIYPRERIVDHDFSLHTVPEDGYARVWGMGSKWISWAISEILGRVHRHKAKIDYKTPYHPNHPRWMYLNANYSSYIVER